MRDQAHRLPAEAPEKVTRPFRQRLVREEDVHDAVDFLNNVCPVQLSKAKGELKKAERRLQRVEAMMFAASDEKSVEAKKSWVRTTDEWQQASDDEVTALIEFEKLKAIKEAKEIIVEVWRTESASLRGARL